MLGIVKTIAGIAFCCCLWGQSAGGERALTLEGAIQEALQNNLDLVAQRLQSGVAATQEISARLRPNPVLTVSGQTLDLLGAKYVPTTPFGPNQFNVHTEFPLERGGKRRERIQLAKEEKSLVDLEIQEATRQVIQDVQSAYVGVQEAQQVYLLARENADRMTSLVQINEARLQAGDLARVELDRSKVAALQFQASMQEAQLRMDQAKLDLLMAMGRKGAALDFTVSGEMRREVVSATTRELLEAALQKRPDYLSSKQEQAKSKADLRLQIANGKPDYSIGTEFTRQMAYGIGGNSLGLYFSMPLAVFHRNQGEIARAQREIQVGAAQSNALAAQIATEVEKAHRQYTTARQLVESMESQMLSQAKSVLETTEYSYRRGEASLVEYLDAQRAFNDAMQTSLAARAAYARSLYRLDSVTGATLAGKKEEGGKP